MKIGLLEKPQQLMSDPNNFFESLDSPCNKTFKNMFPNKKSNIFESKGWLRGWLNDGKTEKTEKTKNRDFNL